MSHSYLRASVATVVVFVVAVSFFSYSFAFASESTGASNVLSLEFYETEGIVAGVSAVADDYGTGESDTGPYCPKLSRTLQKGSRDTSSGGQVSELQAFLTSYYDLDENVVMGGYFGKLTQTYLIKFQKENSLPSVGIAGSMTREKIAQLCRPSGSEKKTAVGADTTRTELPVSGDASVSLRDVMRQKAPKKCSLKTGGSTVYVANGMVMAEQSGYRTLVRDNALYYWNITTGKVSSIPATLSEIETMTAVQVTCTDWTFDASKFEIPAGATVTDLAKETETARINGRDARRVADIKQLQLALELYYDSNGRYPAGSAEKGQAESPLKALVTGGFISAIPADPQSNSIYPYASRNNGAGYLLVAYLENKNHQALARDTDDNQQVDNGIVGCTDIGGIYCVMDGGSSPAVPATPTTPTIPVVTPTVPTPVTTNQGSDLRVVGVYEAAGAQHDFCHSDIGSITVNVAAGDKPIVLALMSYEPVNWNVVPASGANISRVVLAGYNPQTVSGVGSAPIQYATFYEWTKYTATASGNPVFYDATKGEGSTIYHWASQPMCTASAAIPEASRRNFVANNNFFYAYKQGSVEYSSAESKLRTLTGLGVTKFTGSYSGSVMEI